MNQIFNKKEQTFKYSLGLTKRQNNVLKGRVLEKATKQALDKIGAYLDYSREYNDNKDTPDFILDNSYVIECKNWNCEKYYINHVKAYNEIYLRRISYPDLKPLLIISNPKWIQKEKDWLLRLGWKIIELGYDVTYENMGRAISDIITAIRSLPEYVVYYLSNYFTRINLSIFLGTLRLKLHERVKKIRRHVKTRLKRLSDFIKFMFWSKYEMKSQGGIVCILD